LPLWAPRRIPHSLCRRQAHARERGRAFDYNNARHGATRDFATASHREPRIPRDLRGGFLAGFRLRSIPSNSPRGRGRSCVIGTLPASGNDAVTNGRTSGPDHERSMTAFALCRLESTRGDRISIIPEYRPAAHSATLARMRTWPGRRPGLPLRRARIPGLRPD